MKTTKTKPARKEAKPLPDTFTVRDMSRNAAAVLRASLAHGQVRIRSRSGPTFLLMPDKREQRAELGGNFAAEQKAYRERLRALGSRPPTIGDMDRINRIIAGEE